MIAFWNVLEFGVFLFAILLTAIFMLSKCFFLSAYRVGWVMMFANVIYETLFKKFKWNRGCIDAVILPGLTLLWFLIAGPVWAMAMSLVMSMAWIVTLRIDQRWRTGEIAHQDSRYTGRVPIPVPRMVVNIRGPILERNKILELGDWPVGSSESFEILILNPSSIVPQFPMEVTVETDSPGVKVTMDGSFKGICPDPAQYQTIPFKITSTERSKEPVMITVRVSHCDTVWIRKLRLRSVFSLDGASIQSAQIRRWKGGARAGFAWRGDQDLYDPATFQSEQGLRHALGLSYRFRLPSTLYISGALSLNQDGHKAFCDHFGWDRRTEEIPGFIKFLCDKVTLQNELEFPMDPDRKFAMEIGNHMYVHLGTHTGAAEGNNWKSHAWIGDGRYPWQQEGDADSFTEQRDNAIKNAEEILETLGVKVTSWGVPGRTCDSQTSKAVEAAGIEFGTDTNASAFINVFHLVPPHHPEGCEKLVEITKKYPGDPDNAWKIAMLKYWAQAARRREQVFLLMAHHHLLLYEGCACTNMLNEFFYYILGDCQGDYYIATVSSLGKYWQSVMSPKNKCIYVTVSDDNTVTVENKGREKLEELPLEIKLNDGREFMRLVDVDPGQSVQVNLTD